MTKTRILIADDHSLVCLSLASLLGYQTDFEVVGTATNGTEAVRLCGIMTDAAKRHVMVIFKKLGASNRAEAVTIALRRHLLKI